MSRRHHHHNMQPYDYERFTEHPRDRDQTRGIEYQDDSLSSINSDEETYLHHSHSAGSGKDKKGGYFNTKQEATSKSNKQDKSTNNEEFYQKNSKSQSHPANSEASTSTIERLGRLENMLEELLKRNLTQSTPPPQTPEKSSVEKSENKYCLDPRKHSFTTSMWINKIQEISIQNNWSEKSTIQYMGSQMSGIIKAWYNSLPNYDEYTWPEWKILITKMFPDNTDFVTTLKRLVTRLKQAEETITNYYFSKMYLIEACKITGEDAVSCLIDGLNNQSIQEQAKAQNFLTPESLYSQFLSILPDYTVDYSPSVPPTPDSVLNNWYYQDREHLEEEVAEAAAPEEFVEYEEEPRSEEFEYRNQGNQGFSGNEDLRSHSMKSGPKRPGVHARLDKRFIRPNTFRRYNNKIPMAAKVCTICHNRGHLAKHCRNADKMMRCTLTEDVPNNCFYVDCTVKDHKMKGFIDTGCTTVTIREQDVKMLDLNVRPTSKHIQVYGGAIIQVLGEVEVDIEVDSVRARVRAVVVPNHMQEVSVIVGQAFLIQKNISMILKNSTVKFLRRLPLN